MTPHHSMAYKFLSFRNLLEYGIYEFMLMFNLSVQHEVFQVV